MFSISTKKISNALRNNPVYAFLLFLCVFIPFQFALNPSVGFDVAIIRIIIPIIFLAWILFKMKRREKLFPRDTISFLIICFLLLTLFSTLFSSNAWWSFRKILFWASIFPLYFFASSVLNSLNRKISAVTALLVGSTLLAWVAIVQFSAQFFFDINSVYTFLAKNIAPFFLGNSFSQAVLAYPSWLVSAGGENYMRAVAVFPDPHMLSYYFGLLIPWSIALVTVKEKRRGFFLFSASSMIIADIMTFTRGGYLALIAGALIVLPLVSRKNALKILLGVFLLFAFFKIVPNSPVSDRLASSFDTQEGSNQARLSNWEQAISIIAKNPFGVGIGAYSLEVKPGAQYREPIYAHNVYLDIAAELGIISVIVFIVLLLLTLRSFWSLSQVNPFFIAGISSVTIFAIHNVVENPLYSVHVLPLFLIIIALSINRKNNASIDV
ncbi:MAG: polysaccharide polymerase [uncultured bacterium]|nr:MAG: polysaccharide polymerase [uncultured bacterium]